MEKDNKQILADALALGDIENTSITIPMSKYLEFLSQEQRVEQAMEDVKNNEDTLFAIRRNLISLCFWSTCKPHPTANIELSVLPEFLTSLWSFLPHIDGEDERFGKVFNFQLNRDTVQSYVTEDLRQNLRKNNTASPFEYSKKELLI